MKAISFRNDVLPLKNLLYRLALRITLNPAEAEDAVQETMMKVWKRRESWDTIDNIEAFCVTTCRNLSLDMVRRRGRLEIPLDSVATEPADNGSAANPEEQAVRRDSAALVRRIIDSLPEKQRSTMQLRDIEGKSYKEIAVLLDISEEQVKVNIYRARQAVRQQFKKTEHYGL